jgi:predicted nucleotidyltransferase
MPTALELTSEERKRYIEAASRRPPAPDLSPEEKRERERLLEQAREAAAVLKERFGVRRVVLFGSLAHAAWFVPDSDVDLAVEGLADRDYWRAWREIEEIIGDRLVDLIDIERASESLRRAIERYGVEL